MNIKFTRFLFVGIFFLLIIGYFFSDKVGSLTLRDTALAKSEKVKKSLQGAMSISTRKDKFARFTYENRKLVNPSTGKVPANIRQKELTFAKSLKSTNKQSEGGLEWKERGPYNIGGRTRALAIDVSNENILLAGGISGGIWRSENSGAAWSKISTNNEHQGVTCIAQDTRAGYQDTWFYGTGEARGNSASGGGAYYFGNGLYKSTNGGLSWDPVNSTTSNTPQIFDEYFDIIWNVVTDPSATGDTELYVATYGRVWRSGDGGNTWTVELSTSGLQDESYYVDVAITTTGVVYATLSSEGGGKGIWRSEDGQSWTQIIPDDFPADYERVVMGINPSDENEVYFLVASVTEEMGKETFNFRGDSEWNALWRYNYVNGDGAGSGGEWVDLSENLPIGPHQFDDLNLQGGYDMLVRVKPDEPNVVFLGGTNLYRSDDGFTTSSNITFLGGYAETTETPLFELYPNQHPDQHALVFLPSDPNVMISGNDGGIYRTNNCMSNAVIWESLNNGYVTTQFYTVAIDKGAPNNTIIGGLQDNGTRYVTTTDPTATWTMPFNYDGAYCAVPSDRDYFVMSVQLGRVVKIKVGPDGLMTEYTRIDPNTAVPDDYLFINPLLLDPNDNARLYLCNGRKVFGNIDIDYFPYTNAFDSTGVNWYQVLDTVPYNDRVITAMTISTEPANIMYVGTSSNSVFRLDDVTLPLTDFDEISGPEFPAQGYVSCVAVDPRDANKVFVVFSNYEVYSLFYSPDAGETWEKCAGNLEQNNTGSGNGPSLRWLNILPKADGGTEYFLGTSIGLYYTTEIDGINTEWTQQGEEKIGDIVVDMIDSREIDDLVVVATHGNGVFSANAPPDPPVGVAENLPTDLEALKAYPNPTTNHLNITFELVKSTKVRLSIQDELGRTLEVENNQLLAEGAHQFQFDVTKLPAGIYYYRLETANFNMMKSFVKQ